MIFLNPAVLLGLLAASIPVLIHLFNLRKLKRIEFSTLTFLKELQKNKIRKVKLKQWLLLALRVLIILFLVLAFARPTLEGVAIGGTTSAAKTTAVFIIDDTYSMSVVDNEGSYLNQSKEAVKDLLKNMQEGDEVALVRISDQNNEEIKTTSNLVEFEKIVEGIQPTFSSGLIHNSIVKAASILSESKNFNKEIYLFSDLQSGRLYEQGSLSDLSSLLVENVKLYLFNYSGKDIFNLSIDNIDVNTQIFEKDKPVKFSVTVTNRSNQDVNNSVLSLFINDERSSQQSIDLNGRESKIISMESVVKSTGNIDVYAEVEDDDIIFDNKRFTSLFIPAEIPVIIFADNLSDSKFLELALESERNSSLKITLRNTNQISSYDLSKFEAVFIIGSNITGYDRLKSFVSSGGGLFISPASNTPLNSFKKILDELKLAVVSGEFGAAGDFKNGVSFGKVDYQHPLFTNIFSDDNKKKVESPDVYHYFKINPSGGQSIISLIDNSSFLSEYRIGSGKVLVLNSAPVLTWSSFPLKSIFVPLLNKSAYYLASKDKAGEKYFAGEPLNINIGNINLPGIRIEKPDNVEEIININNTAGANVISYNKTDLAGNYRIFSGENLEDLLSINTNPLESVNEYYDEEDIQEYLKEINFKGTYVMVDEEQDPSEMIMQARFGSELWKYFLIIALVLALTEMAIARSAKKDLAEVS